MHWSGHRHLNRDMTKPTKWHVRPAKTQISLGIRPVLSMSSLCAFMVALRTQSFLRRTARICPDWLEALLGAHVILLVLSWCSSFRLQWKCKESNRQPLLFYACKSLESSVTKFALVDFYHVFYSLSNHINVNKYGRDFHPSFLCSFHNPFSVDILWENGYCLSF